MSPRVPWGFIGVSRADLGNLKEFEKDSKVSGSFQEYVRAFQRVSKLFISISEGLTEFQEISENFRGVSDLNYLSRSQWCSRGRFRRPQGVSGALLIVSGAFQKSL